MKWCVVGAGGIADRRMIPALKKSKDNLLAAVTSRSEETACRIGRKYNVPYYTDMREMLNSIECDAVYIASPVAFHKEQAAEALRCGKHVLLEKPVALISADGQAVADIAERENLFFDVGYMMKYHGLHVRAKDIVSGGGIGRVNDVRAQLSCWYPDIAGAWRQNKALGGGGVVTDLGVHCIDLIEFVLGDEIEDVKSFCSTRTFSYEVEDGAVIIFRTKGGALGHMDVNFNVPDEAAESKLELYGSEGSVVCTGTMGQEESGVLELIRQPQEGYSAIQNRTKGERVVYKADGGDLYLKQIEAFAKAVNDGNRDLSGARKAVHVQQIAEKIYADCK